MQLIITGKNMDVPAWLETYVRRKIGKLGRFLKDPLEVRVELSEEKTKSLQQRQVVQVTMYKNGTILRGEERAGDLSAAVDTVVDKLERQAKRYKDKRVTRKRRARMPSMNESTVESEAVPQVVRVKRFRTPPMSEEEAADQMELLGHSFFIFVNRVSGNLNVMYRRSDGNYGVLEPDVT